MCDITQYIMYVYAGPWRRLILRLILTEKITVVDHSLSCPSLGRNLTNECSSRDLAIRRFVPSDKLKWTCWVCGSWAVVVDYLVYITYFRFTGKVRLTISTLSQSHSLTHRHILHHKNNTIILSYVASNTLASKPI